MKINLFYELPLFRLLGQLCNFKVESSLWENSELRKEIQLQLL